MKNQNASTENKMGIMPINKLLISMSLPMIISMLVQALYNIIDSAFVAQISENALTAVSMAFPVQNLMIAVSVGTGVGVNALLSRSLGEKNEKEANLYANHGVFLAMLSYLLFAVFGLFFSEYYYRQQTDIAEVIHYGRDYMFVCTVFSFGVFMQVIFERLMQSTGRTIYNMITQGTGAILNIILDPILIFGLFGFPRLEVKGAAVATVTGQIAAMFLCIYFNEAKNKELQLSILKFRPNGHIIKNIYIIGIPSIIMQSIGSVMTYGMNRILLMFSSTAVAVFGVYFKLQSFIFMPIFGLNNGMTPIIAYNYGAKKKKRIVDTIKLSMVIACSIMLIGLIIFQVFTPQMLQIFNASDDMLSIGVPALRYISISFVFAGFCIIAATVMQALGNAFSSMVISIIRQLVVLLPSTYLFANFFSLDYVWLSFPLAEIASVIASAVLLRHVYNQKIKPL